MSREFAASESTLTLGVTLFLFTFAGSQLFYGPASDRWGRRPIMFLGLAIFIAGGVVCLFASSAEQLIAGRVLQGLGGGVGPAMANAMVLDIFGREGAARMIGYMSIAIPLAPAVAPVVGGILQEAFGWQSVFVVLISLGIVLALTYALMLPETRPARTPDAPSLAANYRTLYSSRSFVGYALVMGLMFGGQLLFISTSSFVLIDHLGLEPRVFGFSFGLVALGIMGGATLSSRLVRTILPRRVVLLGVSLSAGSTAVMLVLVASGLEHALVVLLPMVVTAIGFGLSRPSAMAGALVPFPQFAGLASSMLVFSQMTLSSSYNIAFSQVFEPGPMALAGGMFAALAAALLAVLILRPGAADDP
jgi:DHA1 family bicyclomycin/chloramphenicol resistance-like MFS transporter